AHRIPTRSQTHKMVTRHASAIPTPHPPHHRYPSKHTPRAAASPATASPHSAANRRHTASPKTDPKQPARAALESPLPLGEGWVRVSCFGAPMHPHPGPLPQGEGVLSAAHPSTTSPPDTSQSTQSARAHNPHSASASTIDTSAAATLTHSP